MTQDEPQVQQEQPTVEQVDVVVVGGGAAGLSAGLTLARARRRVVVVDAGHPRNAPAAHVHGFLTREGITPAELVRLGRQEVRDHGGQVREGEVVSLARVDGGLRVTTADGSVLQARAVVVATGLVDELPDVPGLAERWGRDVLHCPYCHGYEVAGRPLAVLAATPMAVHQAMLVHQWSEDLVLLSDGVEVQEQDRARLRGLGIRLVETPVAAVEVVDDRLSGVRLADGSLVPVEAVFTARRFTSNDRLAVALGAATDSHAVASWVVTDDMGRTDVPGLYAAGNVADPMAQVVAAAAQGVKVAATLNADLVTADADRAAGLAPAAA